MRQMGICMEDCGPSIIKWLKNTAIGRFDFNYVEIGIAAGQTFAAMCEVLKDSDIPNWHAYGVDIESGWSFSRETFDANVADFPGRTTLILTGSQNAFKEWKVPIHFCLIDGCHEKDCCKADFEAVEPLVVVGGVVAFHDSGIIEQGSSIQPHRGEPIAVREAIKELGLLDRTRKGWKVLEDCKPPHNSGCFLVRKR